MGVAVADYDGDGRMDIGKTNFSDDVPNLYRNNGDGRSTTGCSSQAWAQHALRRLGHPFRSTSITMASRTF